MSNVITIVCKGVPLHHETDVLGQVNKTGNAKDTQRKKVRKTLGHEDFELTTDGKEPLNCEQL